MDLDKPIIVRKGSKTQNRINLPVTSSFSVGDEVAVVSYKDYLAINGAGNVTAELEEARATIMELKEKIAELTQMNKELTTTNTELSNKVVSLNETITEELKAGQLNSNKVATYEERVKGLEKLIASNEVAYTNGIDNFIRITESAVAKSEEEILKKANDIISSAGLIKRVKGFTITPEELELEAITSGTIAELKASKPIYKLE